jgi:hypothetical protein
MAKCCYYTPFIDEPRDCVVGQALHLLHHYRFVIGNRVSLSIFQLFTFSGRKAEHFFGEKRLITVGFK